jgi:hypothetical protein
LTVEKFKQAGGETAIAAGFDLSGSKLAVNNNFALWM